MSALTIQRRREAPGWLMLSDQNEAHFPTYAAARRFLTDLDRARRPHMTVTIAPSAAEVDVRVSANDMAVILELAQERLDALAVPSNHADRATLERVRDAASDAWLAL